MKVILFSNTDWFMYNFNRSLAISLRDSGMDVILLVPSGPYQHKLANLGFRCILAPMKRQSLNPFRELLFIVWLTKIFLYEKPKIVHSFTVKCALYGSLAARIAGVKSRISAITGLGYVFTNRNLKAKVLAPLLSILMRLILSGNSSRIIVLNRDDKIFFEKLNLDEPNMLHLIPGSGIDCKRFSPSLKDTAGRTSLRVLLASRLLWDKGVGDYIEAAKLLAGSDIEFLLAGTIDIGNPSSVPQEFIQGSIDAGLIKFLGHIDDMPALYNSVDVVVLPSHREGLPTGLTEAGASGLALIATDVPGCREVVTNDVDGLLVPMKSPIAIANAIQRLHTDPLLREKFGRAARLKALDLFNDAVVIKSTYKIYTDLIYKS